MRRSHAHSFVMRHLQRRITGTTSGNVGHAIRPRISRSSRFFLDYFVGDEWSVPIEGPDPDHVDGQPIITVQSLDSAHIRTGLAAARDAFGLTGVGQTAVVIDTGVDYNHSATWRRLGQSNRRRLGLC